MLITFLSLFWVLLKCNIQIQLLKTKNEFLLFVLTETVSSISVFRLLNLILFSYWKDSVRFTSTSPPPQKNIYNDQRSLNMLPNFENAIFYYGPSNVIDHNIRT